MGKVKWNGEEAKRLIRAGFARNLYAATIVVKNHARLLISLEGTGSAIKAFTYHYGGEKRSVRKKGRVYGVVTSQPGEPPRKQLGRLRASVASEVDKEALRGRVGTNVKYGRWLELGTSKMAARPWLRRALAEKRSEIAAILARKPPGMD